MLIESKSLTYMFQSSDCKEGATSFLEKRALEFNMKPNQDMPYFYPWWEKRHFMVD